MALAHSTKLNEIQVLQAELSAIPRIEQAFAQRDANSLVVLVILDTYDRKVEADIIEIEGHLIDDFPWLDIDFDVVFRCGRDLADVVSPKGFQLFAR